MNTAKRSESRDNVDRLRQRVAELETQTTHFASQQQLLHDLLDAVNDAAIVADGRGRVTYWNRGAETLYGYAHHEAIGRPFGELVCNDEPVERLSSAMEDEAAPVERVHRRKNGEFVTVRLTASTRRNTDGSTATVVTATGYDDHEATPVRWIEQHDALTKRIGHLRQQVADRERSEAEAVQFFRISPALFMTIRFDGTVDRVNPALATFLGREASELEGVHVLDLIHPDDAMGAEEQLASILTGHRLLNFPVRTIAGNGQVRWIELSGARDE
ncbi:MAG: PAS domain S-box protein, partial [Myxococcota bacterium]